MPRPCVTDGYCAIVVQAIQTFIIQSLGYSDTRAAGAFSFLSVKCGVIQGLLMGNPSNIKPQVTSKFVIG